MFGPLKKYWPAFSRGSFQDTRFNVGPEIGPEIGLRTAVTLREGDNENWQSQVLNEKKRRLFEQNKTSLDTLLYVAPGHFPAFVVICWRPFQHLTSVQCWHFGSYR